MTDDDHDVEAVIAGTQKLLCQTQERGRLLDALLKAINHREEVWAMIYASESAGAAEPLLMDVLEIDRDQARVVLDMQARKLAATERGVLADEYHRLTADITECELILTSPVRQRELVGTERGEYLASLAEPGEHD
jgi:DNA gyrase/topoisomerase IV subunit A